MFNIFQEEVNVARDHYSILQTTQEESGNYVTIGDGSTRDRVIQWCTKDIFGYCSCKLLKKDENFMRLFYFDIAR
jgi:hypothetical protein